jgi:hypothetical protein
MPHMNKTPATCWYIDWRHVVALSYPGMEDIRSVGDEVVIRNYYAALDMFFRIGKERRFNKTIAIPRWIGLSRQERAVLQFAWPTLKELAKKNGVTLIYQDRPRDPANSWKNEAPKKARETTPVTIEMDWFSRQSDPMVDELGLVFA